MSAKKWWMEIDRQIKEWNLKIGDVALFSGMTRQHYNRLRKGETKLMLRHREEIENALNILNPDEPFGCKIDYLRITFPTLNVHMIVSELLGLDFDMAVENPTARNGYSISYSFGEIYVAVHHEDEEMGVMIEMKGQGCSHFEYYLEVQGRTWFRFFADAFRHNARYRRLDLAIDDYYGMLDIPYFHEKCKKEEYVGSARTFRFVESGQTNRREQYNEKVTGATLYLGSEKSQKYFCLYQKDYEQYEKYGIPLEESLVKNRFEIRLMGENAESAAIQLMNEKEVDKVVFGIVNEYIRFIEFSKSIDHKMDMSTDRRWEKFIMLCEHKVRLKIEPRKFDILSTKRWFEKQVAPTLKGLHKMDKLKGTNYVGEVLKEVSIPDNFNRKLAQMGLIE